MMSFENNQQTSPSRREAFRVVSSIAFFLGFSGTSASASALNPNRSSSMLELKHQLEGILQEVLGGVPIPINFEQKNHGNLYDDAGSRLIGLIERRTSIETLLEKMETEVEAGDLVLFEGWLLTPTEREIYCMLHMLGHDQSGISPA